MNAVRLSPKYQVVISRDVRENLNLIPGQMMQVIAYGNKIELMLGNVPEYRQLGIQSKVGRFLGTQA